jgi:uncharacterized protein
VTGENRDANASAELMSADDALRVAEAALGLGIVRDAMSRAYFAAFHAARALLLLEGLEPKTHAGVATLMGRHLVVPGKLESRFSLLLTRLQAYRQASDYAYSFVASVDDVRIELDATRELVELARTAVAARRRASAPA